MASAKVKSQLIQQQSGFSA
ncbi:hypothetical protein JL09_g5694 [Pichia kudriavzevii]|uniref:Uncharacterized protein n=1 Tax=Pichia kudriavzevii TaxID=4909 RepID=A0A099NTF5_PICKU|nr:hypothetical protein JL09_g5694 [Pichia kudriavzevii]